VEITRHCNNHCPYCDQPRSERDMSLSRFTAILDALGAMDMEAVALGGGEPTLHPALPAFLEAARGRSLQTGLTTNARAPAQVLALADAGLLDRFGVSAGKGAWTALVAHPRAVVNLLLLRDGLAQVLSWATEAVRRDANCLLLLGYKGRHPEFTPTAGELADAFSLLAALRRRADVIVAADDYTRRRLGLSETCGEHFVRFDLDGACDYCCFPTCEYRPADGDGQTSPQVVYSRLRATTSRRPLSATTAGSSA
jgi:hypothetical protein